MYDMMKVACKGLSTFRFLFKNLRPRDLINMHPNSYLYFITAIKHGYTCFIS